MFIIKKFTQRALARQAFDVPLPPGAGRHMKDGSQIAGQIMAGLDGELVERRLLAPSVGRAVGSMCEAEVRFLTKLTEPECGILDFYREEEIRVAEFVGWMIELWLGLLQEAPRDAASGGLLRYRLKLIHLLSGQDVVERLVRSALRRSVSERVDLGAAIAETVASNMVLAANLAREAVAPGKLLWPKDMPDAQGVDLVRTYLRKTEVGEWLLTDITVSCARRIITLNRTG